VTPWWKNRAHSRWEDWYKGRRSRRENYEAQGPQSIFIIADQVNKFGGDMA